jgi:hypothetical protein
VLSSDHYVHIVRQAPESVPDGCQAADNGDGDAFLAGHILQYVKHTIKFGMHFSWTMHGGYYPPEFCPISGNYNIGRRHLEDRLFAVR